MEKDAIRGAHRARRAARIRADGPALAANLLDLLRGYGIGEEFTLAGYLPVRNEPDVIPAMTQAAERGVRVVVPRTAPGGRLEWIAWVPGAALQPDRHGLFTAAGQAVETAFRDPAVVMLIPAMGIDRLGTRLGQGAGYYDRALSELARWPPGPLRVGVVHPEEITEDALPRQSHDEPMDAILTADGWFRITGSG